MSTKTIDKLTMISKDDISEAILCKTIEEIEDIMNNVGVTIFKYRSFRGIEDSSLRSLNEVLIDLSKVWPTLKDNFLKNYPLNK